MDPFLLHQEVAQLLVNWLPRQDLLKCRSLATYWYQHSTKCLKSAGCSVHLANDKSKDTLAHYSRLISATARARSDSILVPHFLPLNLHVNVARDTNIDQTIRNVKYVSTKKAVKMLECVLTEERAHYLREVVKSCAQNVRELSLIIANTANGNGINFQWSPRLRLPRLTSFSVEYCGQNPIVEQSNLLDRFCELVFISPNLVSLRGRLGGWARSHDHSDVLRLVASRFDEGLERLKGLLELELHVATLDYIFIMTSLSNIEYTNLQKLVIYSPGGIGQQAHESPRNLLEFIQIHCPRLISLEFLTTHVDPVLHLEHLEAVHANQARAIELSPSNENITHFRYEYKLRNSYEHPWVWESDSTAVLRMSMLVLMMRRMPHLNSFSTNWETLVALEMFVHASPGLMEESSWNLVKTVTLAVSHSSQNDDLNYTNLTDIKKLVAKLFSNLQILVVNLGADRVAWKARTELQVILNFIFMLEISGVEINNFYNGWILPTREMQEKWWKDKSPNQSLKLISLRGVTPSCVNLHVDPLRFSPVASINLQVLEDAIREIPPSIKIGLRLQIDAELLMNSEPLQAYNQLSKEVHSRVDPSIRLRLIIVAVNYHLVRNRSRKAVRTL